MGATRLPMRKLRDILRLKFEQRLPHRAIVRACGVGVGTISAYARRAHQAADAAEWRGRPVHARVRRLEVTGGPVPLVEGVSESRLRDRTHAIALLEENGRVVGVRAETNKREHTCRARLVVGADGRHSTIASLVDADEYLTWDAPRAA